MKYLRALLLLGCWVVLASCATTAPSVPGRATIRPPEVAPSPTPDHVHPPAGSSATSATLTLDAAIETALLNNPGLQAGYAVVQAAAQKVPQVSSLDDPRISYTQFVEGVQTRTGEQQFVTSVTQMLPWFGKLRLRGEIASSMAMQALQAYRSSMLDVRRDVQRAWYNLAYEQAAFELAKEDRNTLEQSLDAASSLYGSGQKGRGALLQMQTELARMENELAGYPPRLEAFRQRLARSLYVDSPGDVPPLDPFTGTGLSLPPSDLLISRAIVLRPQIERFRLQENEADLRQDLARKDYYPDFTAGFNYIGIGDRPDNPTGAMAPPDEGKDAWGVSVGFTIPIPNARRRAAKLQAEHEREEAQWRRLAAESEIKEDVMSLLPQLTALDHQLEILHTNLVPLAKEAYSTNEAAYTAGRATLLDLLDSQRTLIGVRRDAIKTQRDYLLTIVDLERAVGGSLTKETLP